MTVYCSYTRSPESFIHTITPILYVREPGFLYLWQGRVMEECVGRVM